MERSENISEKMSFYQHISNNDAYLDPNVLRSAVLVIAAFLAGAHCRYADLANVDRKGISIDEMTGPASRCRGGDWQMHRDSAPQAQE